jgi:hypothetical protein
MDPIVYTTKPEPNSLPGFYEPNSEVVPTIGNKRIITFDGLKPEEAFVIESALTPTDCQKLINLMSTSDNFEEVGVQGMKEGKDERIGSVRTSIWCPEIAEQIWDIIHKCLPNVYGDWKVATDWWQGFDSTAWYNPVLNYEPVAVSPLLRFMKYGKGGQHYAHYDAGFIYPQHQYRGLKSMVIYLTTNTGAATRFIKDEQSKLPIWTRKHDDWNREVKQEEIIAKSECIQGNILIFDHRLCHDVEQYLGNVPRMIIRGDIIYKLMK